MTEEDTFNALKRLPLSEVKHLWEMSPKVGTYALYEHVTSHHWTLEEYIRFHYKTSGFEVDQEQDWIDGMLIHYRKILRDEYGIEI